MKRWTKPAARTAALAATASLDAAKPSLADSPQKVARASRLRVLETSAQFATLITNLAPTVIEVTDTGEGIAPEHQANVFARFYRVDETRSRSEGGAGLGLAITRLAVERHGGRVELESEIGKGSVFRILLPQ